MAVLFFLIALVFSMPFPICAEGDDDTDWKPFESFTQYQIRKANDYFSTLNDTQKLDLFGNDMGGKRISPVKIYIQLSKAFHKYHNICLCVKKFCRKFFY